MFFIRLMNKQQLFYSFMMGFMMLMGAQSSSYALSLGRITLDDFKEKAERGLVVSVTGAFVQPVVVSVDESRIPRLPTGPFVE